MCPEFIVYGRGLCHLCDDMLSQLYALQKNHDFKIDYIEITGDAVLEAEYGLKVPVLMAGNQELCHYKLDLPRFHEYLSKAKQD